MSDPDARYFDHAWCERFDVSVDPDKPSCATCRYADAPFGAAPPQEPYRLRYCRRRAPRTYDHLRFYELELLRDIAWSLRLLAKIETPPDDKGDEVNIEAAEAAANSKWPEVERDDWCGEYAPNQVMAFRER